MKKTMLVLSILAAFALTGCGTSVDEKKMLLEPVKYRVADSTFGIKFYENKFGTLITNNNDEAVDFKILTEFYNKQGHYLGKKERNWNAFPPKSQLCIVHDNDWDKTSKVESKIVNDSFRKTKYKTLKVGLDDSCEVQYKFDFTNKQVIVTNRSKYKVWNSGIQFLLYDSNGRIKNVKAVVVEHIPAGKTVSKDCYIGKHLESGYDHYKTTGFGYSLD